MSAWFGPTFRKHAVTTDIMKMKARTAPAAIKNGSGIPNMALLLLVERLRIHLVPAADVRDTFVIAHHHHLRPAVDRAAVFGARAATAPCSFLRVNELPRPARPDRNTEPAENSG